MVVKELMNSDQNDASFGCEVRGQVKSKLYFIENSKTRVGARTDVVFQQTQLTAAINDTAVRI